jgi:hypothetical protein
LSELFLGRTAKHEKLEEKEIIQSSGRDYTIRVEEGK